MGRLLTVSGGIAFVALLVFRFVNGVVAETFASRLLLFALDQAGYDMADLRAELFERGYGTLVPVVDHLTNAPLDVGFEVAAALLAVTPLVAELVYVVSVRAIAYDEGGCFPTGRVTDGFVGAYLKSLVAGFVALVLVFIGFALLVIPGIILAVLFLFVRQAVVLGGKGTFEALSHSKNLVVENALHVVALVLLLVVLWGILWLVTGFIPVGILVTVLWVAYSVFGIDLVTSAYLQAESPAAV